MTILRLIKSPPTFECGYHTWLTQKSFSNSLLQPWRNSFGYTEKQVRKSNVWSENCPSFLSRQARMRHCGRNMCVAPEIICALWGSFTWRWYCKSRTNTLWAASGRMQWSKWTIATNSWRCRKIIHRHQQPWTLSHMALLKIDDAFGGLDLLSFLCLWSFRTLNKDDSYCLPSERDVVPLGGIHLLRNYSFTRLKCRSRKN